LNASFGEKMGLENQHALHGAPMFVPHGTWWDGSDCAATLTKQNANGAQRMPDKDNLSAVLTPTAFSWQNARDGLRQDDAVAALRSSAGDSGFHEMNHPVVMQPVAVTVSNGEPRVSDCMGTLDAARESRGSNQQRFVMQPVPFRKSKRAQSTTDDESWVEAEQANTLNAFDTGERDTHAVAQVPMATIDMQACKGNANIGDGSVSPTLCKPSGNDVHAVAFSPGNLKRGAGAGPNEEVFPTLKCSAGRGADDQRPCVAQAMAFDWQKGNDVNNARPSTMNPSSECTPTISTTRTPAVMQAHGFYSTGGTHGVNQHPEVSPAVKVGSGLGIPSPPAVAQSMTVRRLTPRECERLQAFPDDYTLIPWRKKPSDQCPDGPRYKALGNSMAVNCMEWIGERIAAYEAKERKQ
jgi:site-specific DNA-cytosine methylase